MPFFALLRFFGIVVIQLVAFFFFYNHPHGRRAIYDAWYAWMIDALAIISGATIMTLSAYALYNPWVFTINIPSAVFWLTFIVGGWQAAIHAVKWFLRNR